MWLSRHLVLVGEKSSLRPVLSRVAERFKADLYLPTGEISETQAYQMAKSAADDGRPMVVFYFADCDPAGWQMPISLFRKLQAFKAMMFENIQFQMHRVALTPDQVREYGLPSTPSKGTEKRANDWVQSMRVEQTEIDALAGLRPELLTDLATAAIAPFYDDTLSHRVWLAMQDWRDDAQRAIEAQAGDHLESLHAIAGPRLDEKRQEIQQILDDIRVDADMFELPPVPTMPDPVVDGPSTPPLCDSEWDFTYQCQRLIASKNYDNEAAS